MSIKIIIVGSCEVECQHYNTKSIILNIKYNGTKSDCICENVIADSQYIIRNIEPSQIMALKSNCKKEKRKGWQSPYKYHK